MTVARASVDQLVKTMEDRLRSAMKEQEQMAPRKQLIELIESGSHVLIGAKALAHYTKPRFTQDTDYIVSGQTFQRIRKWMREQGVEHNDLGLVVRFESLGVDVLDARTNDVLKEILNRDRVIASPEALAAAKYTSMINEHRGQRRLLDAADFAQLVTLMGFDLDKLRSYFVGRYTDQWPEVKSLIDDIKAGRPITI